MGSATQWSQPSYSHWWVFSLLAGKTNTESPIWHYSLEGSASYQVAGWLPCTTFIMKGTAFYSYWNRHLLWIWICLSCMQCFCQNNHPWTWKILYPPSWYPKKHCFSSRNSLHSKRNVAKGPSSWNSLLFPCSPQSWSSWLDRIVEGPFEDLEHQLGSNILQGWDKVLQNVVYALNQYQIYGSISPQLPGFKGARIKKWRWNWDHSI